MTFFNMKILIGVRPSNQLSNYAIQNIPGVTLTTCSYVEANCEASLWPDTRRTGSPRCWPQESSDHSDQSGNGKYCTAIALFK